MARNLRTKTIDGELYISVLDLFKVMLDVMSMEGLKPEAVKAIDGLGSGLAISLGLVKLDELPVDVLGRLEKKNVAD